MNAQKLLLLLLLLLLITCSFSSLLAQQLPIFTQYRANRGYINPAAFDIENLDNFGNFMQFGLSQRSQWTKLQSGPKTQTLHGTYISGTDGVALISGLYIVNDRADRVGYTGMYGRIGAVLGDWGDWGISAGLTLGAVQYRIDLSGLENNVDPLLSSNNNKQISPDAGIGIFAYNSMGDNRFYGGISIPQVLGLDLTFKTPNSQFNTQRVRHFYGLLGYYVDLPGELDFIEFSSWVKYVGNVPLNVDANFRYRTNSPLWVGFGYNTGKILHAEIGLSFDTANYSTIKIGYGFDSAFSGVSTYFGSTHEINVAIYIAKD